MAMPVTTLPLYTMVCSPAKQYLEGEGVSIPLFSLQTTFFQWENLLIFLLVDWACRNRAETSADIAW
jgi:hypothetical protein